MLVAWGFRALAFWGTQGLGQPAATFVYATQVPAMLDAFAIGLCIARLHLDGTMARWVARSAHASGLIATAAAFAVVLHFTWRRLLGALRLLDERQAWSSSGGPGSR